MLKRRTLMAGGGLALVAPAAKAAQFPEREITMYVQYAAGGSTDVATRALAAEAEKTLGVPIQIVNRPGGQGTVGPQTVAAARPDGYTIGTAGLTSISVVPHMLDVSYNRDSFTYIGAFAGYRYGLAVRTDSPFRSLAELINHAKTRRTTFSATGAPNNLGVFAVGRLAGVRFQFVPFPSGAEAVTAAMGGHVDFVLQAPPEIMPNVESGRMRLLASGSAERWPERPEAPTFRELGYDVVIQATAGLVGPAGIPADRVAILANALMTAARSPSYLVTLQRMGMLSEPMDGPEFERLARELFVTAGPALREAGLARR
jgi:tripartite-type tricarboxylate transporter receptor subunit TctC